MKKKCINRLITLLLPLFLLAACNNKNHAHEEQTQYTCPMHPQVVSDKPGSCPICEMELTFVSESHELVVDSSLMPLLKAANRQLVANVPVVRAETGMQIFSVSAQGTIGYDTRKEVSVASRVAGRIENMYVKYNYQPVQKGMVIMEIYSPDLAAAQRELLYISKSGNQSLLQKAKEKLQLLGMQPSQIQQVVQTGRPYYRLPVMNPVTGYIIAKNGTENEPVSVRTGQYVAAGETVFTVYESASLVANFYLPPAIARYIGPGKKLLYSSVSDPKNLQSAAISFLEPVQRAGIPFVSARVYLPKTGMQPGQALTARIPIVITEGWWVPQEAVVQLGNSSALFKKENNLFIAKEVHAGMDLEGKTQILTPIDGWEIAGNAGFLVDSESLIKTMNHESTP